MGVSFSSSFFGIKTVKTNPSHRLLDYGLDLFPLPLELEEGIHLLEFGRT